MQQQRPWYVNERGELDANAILSTEKPIDPVVEHYKQLMYDSMPAFCDIDGVYSLEREKSFSAVYSAFCSLLEACGEQSFMNNACGYILGHTEEEFSNGNGKAARHLAQACLVAYKERQAEFEKASLLAAQINGLFTHQNGA